MDLVSNDKWIYWRYKNACFYRNFMNTEIRKSDLFKKYYFFRITPYMNNLYKLSVPQKSGNAYFTHGCTKAAKNVPNGVWQMVALGKRPNVRKNNFIYESSITTPFTIYFLISINFTSSITNCLVSFIFGQHFFGKLILNPCVLAIFNSLRNLDI